LEKYTQDLAPTHILDIGAGSGFFSKYLLNNLSSTKAATCIDIGYDTTRQIEHSGKPIHYRPDTPTALDADMVLLMDVLEHVPNENDLLKPYIDIVPSGTRFIITVPAFQMLWSDHDVFLEHHRRYTLKQLAQAIEESGLEYVRGSYYFGAVFPLAMATRLLKRPSGTPQSQLKRHSPLVNGILKTMCIIERPLMGWNKIMGLSVFAEFRKP